MLGAGLFAVGVLLAAIGASVENATPRSALHRWHLALAAGDVSVLATDIRLGSEAWTEQQINSEGERDFQRVLALYNRANAEGQSELQRLETAVREGGLRAFNGLAYENRRAVSEQSHNEWVFEQGFPLVPDASAVGDWRALTVWPPTAAMTQRLGAAALSEEERGLLGNRAGDDPAVMADPMLQDLATRRGDAGLAAYRSLRDRVFRAGEQVFRRLDYTTRRDIDGRSEVNYVLVQGIAALPPADRQRVSGPAAFTDESTRSALQVQLGLATLTEAERREVAAQTMATFIEHRPRYVRDAGVRLLRVRLREVFGGSAYEVASLRKVGANPRDLIQRSTATAHLRWSRISGDPASVPEALEMVWAPFAQEWRIDQVRWRSVTAHPSATGTPEEAAPGVESADGGAP